MSAIQFKIEKKIPRKLGRAGVLTTPHGTVETPAFVVVGTKATVKSLTPEQVASVGTQIVLANTYHLYLQPGEKIVSKAGGLHDFMNWQGPTMTDSGGFQAFSLGVAYGQKISKIKNSPNPLPRGILEKARVLKEEKDEMPMAKITDEGVEFRSVIDGSRHFFSPEKSIEIQRAIGADIIFAFDECVSPLASYEYQKSALERTHRWADRSLMEHKRTRGQTQTERRLTRTGKNQALFGIVQGGRFEDLRKASAKFIGGMEFDGFGIGGSFEKKDIHSAVAWVNKILPEEKPRHLLGIGEPHDLFGAVENGCDLFDCVAPTRMARNGTLYTARGRINILNAKFRSDFSKIDRNCGCYTCQNFTKAYVAHLFRAKEILANTLASIHNLYFIVGLVSKMRSAILDGNFNEFKDDFLRKYGTK
ncbi:MAG: tRNA guanosine(34) transglycosylase Tgt [Candidatus Taylorbacteria bacterium]